MSIDESNRELQSEADLTWLLQQAREGMDPATQRLLDEYGPALIRMIRRKLATKMRRLYDSDDFKQRTWLAVLQARIADKTLATGPELRAFLEKIAENEVGQAARKFRRTEPTAAEPAAVADAAVLERQQARPAPGPSAEQVAEANETWDWLVRGERPLYRGILGLLRQGYTQQEAAVKMDVSERTVGRLVARLRDQPRWHSEVRVSLQQTAGRPGFTEPPPESAEHVPDVGPREQRSKTTGNGRPGQHLHRAAGLTVPELFC